MSWVGDLFNGSAGKIIESVGNVVDQFHTSTEEKGRLKLELESLLQKRDSEIEQTIRAELNAKKDIIKAELEQKDNYTKRARPTVVYVGLVMIFSAYIILPCFGKFITLPQEFWWSWGTVVSIWQVGRTTEKFGVGGKVVEKITGNQRRENPSLDSLFK